MKNNKNKTAVVPAATAQAVSDEALCAALQTETGKEVLGLVLTDLFTTGQLAIPDDAIVGIYAGKINQLEAQIKSQLDLIRQLAAELRGTKSPGKPAGSPVQVGDRVDPIAAAAAKQDERAVSSAMGKAVRKQLVSK